MRNFFVVLTLYILQSSVSLCLAQEGPTPSRAARIETVQLYDLITAGKTLVAVGERGLVMRTDDEGKTWSSTFSPTNRTLVAAAFADDKIGVAVGHGGAVVRTEDGGRTWNAVLVNDVGSDSLLGVTHLPGGRFVAVGAFGLYIESLDKGVSWRRRQVIADDFDRHLSKIVVSRNALVLVGESGTIARSRDFGATWERIHSPYEGSFFGGLTLADGSILIYGMRGNIYLSEDEGFKWKKVPFGSTGAINGGSVGPAGQVVLVGNDGLIATSTDHGRSFTTGTTPNGLPLAAAHYVNSGALVYVGYLSNGRIEE